MLLIFSKAEGNIEVERDNVSDIVILTDLPVKGLVKRNSKQDVLPTHEKKLKKAHLAAKKPSVRQVQATHSKQELQPSQSYFIQVGAFQKKIHAQQLRERLVHKYWPVLIQKKKRLYTVQIGPYESKKIVNNHKKKLFQQEKLKGFIIHRHEKTRRIESFR
ncbi:MAG: SPOR domain-containing protein [Mariprofundaceae bacterium]|nr:SPOR domain-containing protein [Mariprofundaceae bacterium]